MQLLAARRCQSHHLLLSPGPRSDTGGLLIGVQKELAPAKPWLRVYCPGRIAAAHITTAAGDELVVVNIHNFDVGDQHISELAQDAEAAAATPNRLWVLTGDWNFGEVGAPTLRTEPRGQTRAGLDAPERRRWQRLYPAAVEVTHGHSTRYAFATDPDDPIDVAIVHRSVRACDVRLAPHPSHCDVRPGSADHPRIAGRITLGPHAHRHHDLEAAPGRFGSSTDSGVGRAAPAVRQHCPSQGGGARHLGPDASRQMAPHQAGAAECCGDGSERDLARRSEHPSSHSPASAPDDTSASQR